MRDIDGRSDIYSLGATLYYVLTRREPHKGDDPFDVIVKVLQCEPPRPRQIVPDLPEAVEAIILKAMARVKEARKQGGVAGLSEWNVRWVGEEGYKGMVAKQLQEFKKRQNEVS